MKRKSICRIIAALLSVIMLLSMLPLTVFAAPASDIPDEMLNNVFLDALAYTGYNVQSQKDDGTIYKTYGSRLAGSSVLSGIHYSYVNSGKETSGGKPDIAKFRSDGLCCASYVSYVYFNYLPNVAGCSIANITEPENLRSAPSYKIAADAWVAAGISKKISFTQNSNGDNFIPSEEIPIGSLIIFKEISTGDIAHVALYAGYYNGIYFITHVGNDRGPEMQSIVGLSKGGIPEAVAHIYTPPMRTEQNGEIHIIKKDPNGKNLSGAVFSATNKKTGNAYKIGPTGTDGSAFIDQIPYGDYKVVETVFPQNYRTSGQSEWNITVGENNNGIVTINAVNEEIPGSCKIVKTSEDGKVDGIKFKVTGNGVDQTVVTTSDGTITVNNLKPGQYTVTEVVADKYEPQESRSVTVVSNQTSTVTFNNTLRRGNLTVTKTAEDGLVEGLKFHLYGTSLSGLPVDEYAVVDGTGKAYFKDVLIGTGYTLEEVDTPDKYIVPDNQTADIEWKKVTEKSFVNDIKPGDLTVTKIAEDGLDEGVTFHLYGTSYSGLYVDEYATSDDTGKAYFKDIYVGTGYTLEEVGVDDKKYIIPDKQIVDIEWNKVTETSFENYLKRGDLIVTKTAEDGLEEGIKFHLYGTSYSTIPVDEYAIVDSTGKAYFRDILVGDNYTLEESDTDIRYVVPVKQDVVIEYKTVTDKTVDNRLKKWNLTVTKSDSQTSTPQGDGSLAGAVYGIFKDDELVDNYTTDSKGQFTTKYYTCGSGWTLRELKPGEGYLINTDIENLGVEPKNYTDEYNSESLAVSEDVIKGKISIIKHNDDGSTQIETPEVGATFEVYLKSAGSYENAKNTERDLLVCDENGFDETKELPYGIYTVKQTSGWDGRELMKAFDVYINQDGHTYRYLLNNAPFESHIKIVKTDSETGKTIPYAGAAFQIYDPSGNKIEMTYTYPEITTIDTFYTTEDGTLITPEPLVYGQGYSISEVQAPYGYVLNSEPVYFDVTEDNSTEESGITIVIVQRPNTPQKGTITVSKTGEVFSSVVKSGDVYRPVYAVKGLSGAVFEIEAAEDIYTPDGTLRYSKGEIVATITTREDGSAVTEPLYLGKFKIREVKAPHGMVLNTKTNMVELTYAGQNVEITAISSSFYNERQHIKIDLSKIMEQDEKFGIGMNGEILSVQFGLFAAENITAADGSIIPKDGLIEIISCDENGYAAFTADLPVGAKLYVKEISTNNNYVISDKKYPVIFKYAGQDTAIVDITVNNGEPIINEIIYGTVSGHKIDRETEENISGALFGLFKADETEFNEDTALYLATSDENGIFTFENIPFGGWIVKELMPAVNYLPNDELHHINVSYDEEVIEITVINDKIPEIGTLATVDNSKEINATEVFTLEDVVSYKHLIPGVEYTLKGVLMDKNTGEPLKLNGEMFYSSVNFIPDSFDGEISVLFTFDAKFIKEETQLVVFEYLYRNGAELTSHTDIEDEGQTITVHIPEIGTTATVDGEKEFNATDIFTLKDVVSYKNLTPGKEYTLKGVLMNKTTGEPLMLDGEQIKSETTFIPESSEGEAEVTFTFDARFIKEEIDIVVFEGLYREETEISVHADIEDQGQTVSVHIPEIGTQAAVNGEKVVAARGEMTIDDTVSYKNLTPGKEYTIKGILMDKSTGEPFIVDGKEVHSEVTFTPKTADGEIIVSFTFDATGLTVEKEVVVFESIFREQVEIAVHADIEDDNQTVKLIPPVTTPDYPKTGEENHIGIWIALVVVSALGIFLTGFSARNKRKTKKIK